MATRTSRDSANTSTGIDHRHAASSRTTETSAVDADVAQADDRDACSDTATCPRAARVSGAAEPYPSGLNTNAHGDHIEAHSLMKELTGAQVVMSEADGVVLADGGGVGPDGQPRFKPVTPDRVVRTGDTVTLGGTTLTAHIFPGHTRGATTWKTVVEDGGQRSTFVFWGGLGGVRQPFVNNTEWPTIAEDYADTLRRAKPLPCELGAHGRLRIHGQDEPSARWRAAEPRRPPPEVPAPHRTPE